MRISDSHFTNTMLTGMSKSNTELSTLLQQMYTGEKITKPSDDPIATIKLMGLEKTQAEISQYKDNNENVKSGYQLYETHIANVVEGLQSTNELLLWGLNGTMTLEDRAGIVTELESLHASMVSTFNAKNSHGSYLFSGTATDQKPFNITEGVVTANPAINNNTRETAIGDGIMMQNNLTLEKVDAAAILVMLETSITELSKADPNLSKLQEAHNNSLISLNKASSSQAYAGSQINNIDRMLATHSDTELFATKLVDQLTALSYDEASLKLNDFMSALEATQKTFAQISSLSLFKQL
ncbi:flagellar hook-associated protein 3 [Psychromonas ingrahamii 37]|uniref:Flagellar hook-associated protein 3 n=1 Tax=Psychromonas ingrahamii (strain DSM 17664 / CCUG 51855 / 37) TaxID=357804 RepID=A1T0I6_PSYIN|nr:flagellar hook-associated protein FlgL [Psychromonas ingrahamii]ABM05251.1 flagellar hook-associated protein 3 [Psychromonas ingrahamii 37]